MKLIFKEESTAYRLRTVPQYNLSFKELITIILGNTVKDRRLAEKVWKYCKAQNKNVYELSIAELEGFLSPLRASRLYASICLSSKRTEIDKIDRPQITCSRDVNNLVSNVMTWQQTEMMYLILLDRSNRIILRNPISLGGVSGTVIDIKIILKKALEFLASSIIICHNHPSGNLNPSQNDIDITKKIKEASKIMDVSLLDHLIIGNEGGYYSFADEGLL